MNRQRNLYILSKKVSRPYINGYSRDEIYMLL